MAFRNRRNSLENTGFDNRTGNTPGRLINPDGSSNIIKTGIPFFKKYSAYHTLIIMPFWAFTLFALGAFIVANFIFAGYYFALGPEALGLDPLLTAAEVFQEDYFFSVQTLTTVGYGHHYPHTFHANMVSAFETLFGWMAFAVLTGLLYGRFSRPKPYIIFSKNALISPYKEGTALMFRLAPYKNTLLTEAEIKLNLSIHEEHEGQFVNRFYPLETVISKINTLALNWTIVHPINEESPLYNMDAESLEKGKVEILVFLRAFDEHFSNTVQKRHSFIYSEIAFGGKFKQMFHKSEDQIRTILELDKIDDYEKLHV